MRCHGLLLWPTSHGWAGGSKGNICGQMRPSRAFGWLVPSPVTFNASIGVDVGGRFPSPHERQLPARIRTRLGERQRLADTYERQPHWPLHLSRPRTLWAALPPRGGFAVTVIGPPILVPCPFLR